MTRVHQLLAAAAPGDAVTGQALAWADLLARWGHTGDIVAEHVHPDLAGRVRRLADVRDLGGGSLILHLSIGSAVVGAALEAGGPLAVCYHNVTPGHLLRPHNPALADDCDRARAMLPGIVPRAVALVADSTFNAQELEAAGGVGVEVVPLLLDLPSPPDAARPVDGPPSVISVGRVVPNKRLEDVIRAFTLYQREHAPDARLTLVGGDGGFTGYRAALELLATRVGATGVRLTGWVADDALEDAWAGAHAYLCMSEHEGFCAPLVEAMARGVPVVARDAGAIRETVGGAGLVIERDLPLAAEALAEVIGSPATRSGLARAARRRLAGLDHDVVAGRLRDALAPVLDPGRPA
ncbi:glycosyltransferase family 4 protein [Miltoncostaea oceani]|uniref:glycosyltransferase family 4 protein n=1 Tax=Miltoncostaea oceani TaxID=2843216 RepID=UPI001C3D5A8F|nr:glycosyltransferase family 4 protein [Miltoncostaea oceani]